MADIRSLPGVHYNPAKIKSLADVVTPPYDVISSEQRAEYMAKSPWNVVRLILPEGDSPYENARETLQKWMEQQVLIQDPRPGMYAYHQTFQKPDGETKTRKGFLARVRIEDYEKKIVLPHEATLFAPKQDRLNLLRATKTNFCPIFGLYSDPELTVDQLLEEFTSGPPWATMVDDAGITNSLWCIPEEEVIQKIQKWMADQWILIADGHHRYESCIVYRNEMMRENPDPEAPFQFTLMFLTNIHHPGITVLPYNRGVQNLTNFNAAAVLQTAKKFFDIKEFEHREQALFSMKIAGAETTAFLALLHDTRGVYLFKLKSQSNWKEFFPPEMPDVVKSLDLNVLHRLFIQEILSISEEDVREQKYLKYYKDVKDEMKDFDSGRLQIAFFLNPTRVEQVVEVSKTGEKMPQKSTFFYPKVMTGFVMNRHDS
jgi:uncharacterized protein (DUF1015 family)